MCVCVEIVALVCEQGWIYFGIDGFTLWLHVITLVLHIWASFAAIACVLGPLFTSDETFVHDSRSVEKLTHLFHLRKCRHVVHVNWVNLIPVIWQIFSGPAKRLYSYMDWPFDFVLNSCFFHFWTESWICVILFPSLRGEWSDNTFMSLMR